MCLTTTQEKPFIARRNLPVLKVMVYSKNGFRTPYLNFPMDDDFFEAEKFGIEKPHSYYKYIYQGIHSLYAVNFKWELIGGYNEVLFEAYIPKGTPFFIGVYNDIVSLRLNFGKICASNYREGYLERVPRIYRSVDYIKQVTEFWDKNIKKMQSW